MGSEKKMRSMVLQKVPSLRSKGASRSLKKVKGGEEPGRCGAYRVNYRKNVKKKAYKGIG